MKTSIIGLALAVGLGGLSAALSAQQLYIYPNEDQSPEQQQVDQGIEDGDGVDGERDGIGWSIAVGEDTGQMVASASADEVGFVIFGICSTF